MSAPARASALAPFQVPSFRFQWPADLATSFAFEMETLILGWYVLVETGSVLLLKEFQIVDVYARAGLAHWKVDGSATGLGSDSQTGDEFTYGVGVGVHFGSVGVRAEYERFRINDFDTNVNTLSIGFTYTFL